MPGPIFSNSKRLTIHRDLRKNWDKDSQSNLGNVDYRSSIFANKKGGDEFTEEEQKVIKGFVNFCSRTDTNLNLSIQVKVGDSYTKVANCTLFANTE